MCPMLWQSIGTDNINNSVYVPEVSPDEDAKYPRDMMLALLTSVLTADDDTNVGRNDESHCWSLTTSLTYMHTHAYSHAMYTLLNVGCRRTTPIINCKCEWNIICMRWLTLMGLEQLSVLTLIYNAALNATTVVDALVSTCLWKDTRIIPIDPGV